MTSGHIRTLGKKYFKSGNVKPKLILLQFLRYHVQIINLGMLKLLQKYKWHCSFVLLYCRIEFPVRIRKHLSCLFLHFLFFWYFVFSLSLSTPSVRLVMHVLFFLVYLDLFGALFRFIYVLVLYAVYL